MADSIIVGQFVGSSALAAVGACAALTNVFIVWHWEPAPSWCACEPLFRCQRVWQNENHCVNVLAQLLILSIVLGILAYAFPAR